MGTRVYLGNLPYSVSVEDIKNWLGQTGRLTVKHVKIVTDPDTGRARGFAFAELGSEDEVRAAIAELDGQDFGGRRAVVNEAVDRPQGGGKDRPQGRGGGGGQRPSRGGGQDRGGGRQDAPRGGGRRDRDRDDDWS